MTGQRDDFLKSQAPGNIDAGQGTPSSNRYCKTLGDSLTIGSTDLSKGSPELGFSKNLFSNSVNV